MHYRDIELIASKTYIREVVLIIIYSEGSFFVTLSAGVGDQPLLDMSFPDVSSRGRGYQIAQYNHSVYRKLSLWQSSHSLWESRFSRILFFANPITNLRFVYIAVINNPLI